MAAIREEAPGEVLQPDASRTQHARRAHRELGAVGEGSGCRTPCHREARMSRNDMPGGFRDAGDREPKWRRYLRFYRPDPVADLDDELRDHLESTEESLIAQGMS